MSFETYQSPFSWRYGSSEMKRIWGEEYKRLLWRRIWVALAETQIDYGLVTKAQLNDLLANMKNVDIDKSLEYEAACHHDLVAEIKAFAEQCTIGGAIIHLGATSMDIKDNAIAMQIKDALAITTKKTAKFLNELANLCEKYADTKVVGFTHLQPAEPTTLGYRFALVAQDMLNYYRYMKKWRDSYRGKGFKGAVGNSASYMEYIGKENLETFENKLAEKLQLDFFRITCQTYPRSQEFDLLSDLAGMAAILNKLAFDIRILQNPMIGEVMETFSGQQVGSSAMPFKRNPIQCEKINSLARQLARLPDIAWDNTALSLLERTLDDSANRRTIIPQAFLIMDEMLETGTKLLGNLVIDQMAITRNFKRFAPFSALERVLTALSKAGMDRQTAHEKLRGYSMIAWEAVKESKPNPIMNSILSDESLLEYVAKGDLEKLFNLNHYLGFAADRAKWMANETRKAIE